MLIAKGTLILALIDHFLPHQHSFCVELAKKSNQDHKLNFVGARFLQTAEMTLSTELQIRVGFQT